MGGLVSTLADEQRSTRRHVVASVAVVLTVALAAIAAFAYGSVGWHRATSVCTTDAAVPAGARGDTMEQGWSWSPLGFACTWPGDGGGGSIPVVKAWW